MMFASPWPIVFAIPDGLDGRHPFVQGVEPGLSGHVPLGAIAERRHHGELLFLPRLHHPVVGINLDADHRGIVIARPGCSLLEPERQKLVRGRVRLELLAAAVGHGQSGLEQEQAFLGRERSYPPFLGTLDDRGVIAFGLEPQQRELESPLPCWPP